MPLLIHTVNAAVYSNLFDIIHVSTDTEEIANIVRSYGITVPVLRSKENSSSESTSMSVIFEVIAYYESLGVNIKKIALLQPTSPLRDKEDIVNAFSLFNDDVYSVISVTKNQSSDTDLEEYLKTKEQMTSDDFKSIFGDFIINGAIYLLRRKNLGENKYYSRDSRIYIMDLERSLDIDTQDDYNLALKLYSTIVGVKETKS